jgi:PglZ domain
VNEWLRSQIGRALAGGHGPIVLLDPDGVIAEEEVADLAESYELVRVRCWADLRRTWDLDVRRGDALRQLVVLVVDRSFQTAAELPFDIEQEAMSVVRVRWPVPASLHALFRAAGDHRDALANAARSNTSDIATVTSAFAIRAGNSSDELGSVARIRLDPSTPTELWDCLDGAFATELAQSVVADRGDLVQIQTAWNDWLRDGMSSPYDFTLRNAPGPLISMLSAGLLSPAAAMDANLPRWTSVGASEPDPDALTTQLLAAQPAMPTTLPGWIETASWWGQLRGVIAAQPTQPPAYETAWAAWEILDEAFVAWLRRSYGSQLLSASSTPRGVHQVAPFLARRVDSGSKVVLLVVDGLGFAQWHQLRTVVGMKAVQATGCLAMIPTLTTVSRQAIFAGSLPLDFPDTLKTTSGEPKHWLRFWTEHGLLPTEVSYHRTTGADVADVPELGGRAVGIVVNAVDEILHSAEVLGDRQVSSSVDLWARAGFVSTLLQRAAAGGYEVWITSDHGNLPTIPGNVLREGQTVYDAAGTRVRLYPNEVLRSRSAAFGVVWDPPGYPRGTRCPLFASGRTGFHGGGSRVSHGGLSMDEVIVPFAQVVL